MDLNDYQKEVNRLSNELNLLDAVEPVSGGKIGGLMRYKNYGLIILGTLFSLLILKPKFVLKIILVDDTPQIVLNKSKFVLYWMIISLSLSLIYFTYLKVRKVR